MKTKGLEKILKRCLKGERKAQFALYEQCFEELMRTCARYKRNREDAVALLNDGFLKILLHLHEYDFQRNFMSWANTVVIRTAIDDHRRNHRYETNTDFKEFDWELEEIQLNQENQKIIEQLSEEEVENLIFSLPENERMVFTLYEAEGYSHQEIARELNCSERTTKRYLKKAKCLLREMIKAKKDLKNAI